VFLQILSLTAPLFLLVLIGYILSRWGGWPKTASDALTRFVFSLAIPTLLFRMMSDFSRLPPTAWRLLVAFFGSCLLVFVLGRLVARFVFHMDGVSQSVFALGGIFSNNVLLGIPLAEVTLGRESIPAMSLVLVFNTFTLWTLVTVSVEWSRHRAPSWRALLRTIMGVLTNPVVVGVLSGTAFGFTDGQAKLTVDLSPRQSLRVSMAFIRRPTMKAVEAQRVTSSSRRVWCVARLTIRAARS
jgi:hypothetical protein